MTTQDRVSNLVLWTLLACLCVGLAQCADAQQSAKSGPESVITITTARQDPPEFERTYTATVGRGFRVEIRMKTYLGSRMDWSTLYQPGGRYILFDAGAVADKIIDRELYPHVQLAVNHILKIDRAYVASRPGEFTDENGDTWRRVEKGKNR